MKASRTIAFLFLSVGVLGMTFSTGAFTQITADRGSTIESAADPAALVGLDIQNPVEATSNSPLVTVTNNINQPLHVTLTLTETTDPGVSLVSPDATIPKGASAVFDVDIHQLTPPPKEIEFELAATGTTGGFSVTLTRSTRVESITVGRCAGSTLIIDADHRGDVLLGEDEDHTDILIKPGVTVHGDIDAPGCVTLEDKARAMGDVTAGEQVTVATKAKVLGDVTAGADTILEDHAQIHGAVEHSGRSSDGDVILGERANVFSDIESGGSVSLDAHAEVKGAVHAPDAVRLADNARVLGDVDAGAAVILQTNAQIKRDVVAASRVEMGERSQINGDVTAHGNVTLYEHARIKGDLKLTGNGTVDLREFAMVNGDLTTDGTITLLCGQHARINSRPCSDHVFA